MPTRLAQTGYRRFDYQGRGSKAAGAAVGTPKTEWLRGPWPGYQPDLHPAQADPGAAVNCTDMIDREGTLTHQNGYERAGAATLPLGDPALPSATPEPIVGLFEGKTLATQVIRRYAISSDTGSIGHLFEYSAGAWTNRVYDTTPGPAAFTGDASDAGATLVDTAHFHVGDYTVIASGAQGNALYRMPRAGNANEYGDLGNLGALTSLKAQSVCISEERIHAFSTTENGTYFPARWRWSSKGANGAFDPSLTGAGFADLNEFGGRGLAVRNLGSRVALYLNNGVLLARRTGITTDPFAKDYTYYGRGLLGTHSVVELGDGTHFGIFTDGWFRFNQNGQWEERGRTQGGYHKWKNTFYTGLKWTQRDRVWLEYDENDQWVYIAWTESGSSGNAPTKVWIYDIVKDTCWPANWPAAQIPNVFGKWTEEASASTPWSGMAAAWSSTSGSWGSFEATIGQKRIVHGTGPSTDNGGLVYAHNPALVTRDSSLPSYSYQSHLFGGDRPDQFKRADKLYVNYTRVLGAGGTNPTPIALSLTGDTGKSFANSVDHTKGSENTQQEDFISGAVSAQNHQFTLGGQAPVKLGGVGLSLYTSEGEVRKEGSV